MNIQQLERRYKHQHWPAVLVLKGKHDNAYYLVKNIDDLIKAARTIVELCAHVGYYSEPKEPELEEDISDEILALFPPSLKSTAMLTRRRNVERVKHHEEDVADWVLIQRALAGDGLAAYEVISNRKGAEYEGWSLEPLTTLAE